MSASASIVIPTYNRIEELQKVLRAIEAQDRPAACDVQIVVVDDGSNDGTAEWLCAQSHERGLEVVTQSNAGPAKARNRGVQAASGDIILFLGDDTEPQPGWLAHHLEEHRLFGRRAPLAVLGYTSFATEFDSPFLRFINEYGAQFGYLLIDDPTAVPFNFFYTSNVSIPRAELTKLGGFREDFPAAAWEDIELSYRAHHGGLIMRYQPLARSVHNHRIRPRTFCRRQRTSGRSAAIFAELHPELREFLGVQRLGPSSRTLALQLPFLWLFVEFGERIDGLVPRGVYQRFLDACYLRGLAEGLHSSRA
jgi:GT2 family glycosyltransferase